ncbi:MAG: response regulator [Nitrospinae bacterium]|nr:response regulator [Nitrospinota bacterium]
MKTSTSLKILLIEDNPGDARLIKEMCVEAENLSFEMDWTERLSDAIGRLAEKKFDVVLLDLSLPDSHGFETFAKARDSAPNVPIVILSGLDDQALAMKAVQAGAQDYLVKGQVSSMIVARVIRYAMERKKIEESLRKAKVEAEEANKLKDKFLALVSHDLKGPLTSIMGFIELIRQDLQEFGVPEKVLEILDIVHNSTKKMHFQIDDLLNLSRLRAGKITPKLKFFDVSGMILDALEGIKFLARKKEIDVVNKVPDHTRVYADPTLFFEVIQNLVTNAIKFCRKGDQVTIFLPENERSTIAVADTGTGIKPELVKNIFNYLIRTTTTGTAGEIGTGLGLPFSRDIMEAHGGALRVESAEGKGSVFYAALPCVKPGILLVEDELEDMILFKKHLEKLDVDIFAAENGQEAMKILEENSIHLIIADIRMPLMDGFELLQNIKKISETNPIPVILVTGKAQETREYAFKLGAVDFITKPVDFEKLLQKIRKFLYETI